MAILIKACLVTAILTKGCPVPVRSVLIKAFLPVGLVLIKAFPVPVRSVLIKGFLPAALGPIKAFPAAGLALIKACLAAAVIPTKACRRPDGCSPTCPNTAGCISRSQEGRAQLLFLATGQIRDCRKRRIQNRRRRHSVVDHHGEPSGSPISIWG
jgi:hypothetical protein